jgi:hypothetical protein
MRTIAGALIAVACVVTACGGGSGAQDELRRLVARDDEVAATWERIGLDAVVDVSTATGTGPTAIAIWTENYDGVLTVEDVTDASACDDVCTRDVADWVDAQLAVAPLPTVAADDLCGNCEQASRLSLITIGDDGRFVAVGRGRLGAALGEIDSPYEVMLTFGESTRVRSDGERWRAMTHHVLSDCDPFVDEYTMWSLDRAGGRDELARYETSDDSCA